MAERSWTLESGYRLELFSEQDRITGADAIELWINEAGLSVAEAERRVEEILLIATHPEGALAGISSVFLQYNEQLRAQFWYGREFVAAAHRKAGIMMGLAYFGRDYLKERFVSGEDPRAIGMLFEVESEVLKRGGVGPIARFGPKAQWPTEFTFIGENERADHVRVHYFPGALAPEPEPPGARPQGLPA